MEAADGAGAVFARGGAGFVAAEGGRVQPGAGDGMEVSRDRMVGPVQRLGRPRLDRLVDLLGPGWRRRRHVCRGAGALAVVPIGAAGIGL